MYNKSFIKKNLHTIAHYLAGLCPHYKAHSAYDVVNVLRVWLRLNNEEIEFMFTLANKKEEQLYYFILVELYKEIDRWISMYDFISRLERMKVPYEMFDIEI